MFIYSISSYLLFHFSISDFLVSCGVIYVSQYSTLMQMVENATVPQPVGESAKQLWNPYLSIEAVKRSLVKQRVSIKGKVVKVRKCCDAPFVFYNYIKMTSKAGLTYLVWNSNFQKFQIWAALIAHAIPHRNNPVLQIRQCLMILIGSSDILKNSSDNSVEVFMKSFSDDQTMRLVILNKASDIL